MADMMMNNYALFMICLNVCLTKGLIQKGSSFCLTKGGLFTFLNVFSIYWLFVLSNLKEFNKMIYI